MGEKKYSVILADPPWHYHVYSKKMREEAQRAIIPP